MLHNGRAGYRQLPREFTSGPGRACKALKDNHPDWVTEQSEYAQDRPERSRVCVGFGHVRSVRQG
jgi:hypothetical protein